MKGIILHGATADPDRQDELDTLIQAEAVRKSLTALGHRVTVLPLSLDLEHAAAALRKAAPDFVFNLVESVEGAGRLIHLAPTLLDYLGIPYTGAGTEAMFLTSNKLLAKRVLHDRGIPTPHCYAPDELAAASPILPGPYIIKSVWEHASVGLDEDAVVATDRREVLARECRKRARAAGSEFYAEAFVDGREFNVPLLAGPAGVEVLPISEILFVDYGPDKWKVVGYRAKWDAQSFEFSHTPRHFDFPPEDRSLLDSLATIARQCWHVFGLRGYARVDFRVDSRCTPLVLEINANPCLSPDGGFAAAVAEAGLTLDKAIERILGDAPTRVRARAAKAGAPAQPAAFTFREEATEADRENVRRVLDSTGFFYPHEVAVAVELVEERLQKGCASGYHFVFAEQDGRVVGYTCYGPIACTASSYDLYWIAVESQHRGAGLGRLLMEHTEHLIAKLGGKQIYIETSNREQYKPTRAFYLKCGYREAATLAEFYGPADDKVVYVKHVDAEG